ncbi:MAG: polysaccharide deacetylase [Pseudorhodoplanes sp.]|uniref:polysaccharide deacetylase family protein n=1 Tax=Pseudorhodoplanes sp. TaxID=1934341 RepID=UPI003D11DA73
MSDATPVWAWPDEKWRRVVDTVRAGRRLRPTHWKDGAQCAVALSFDVDHETNELRDGGRSIGRLSWGQFGSRVGVPRILRTLKKYDVRATFFVPAVTALLHPKELSRIAADGHEVGLHGWIHEVSSSLAEANERDLMLRAADSLEGIVGTRPAGIRGPSMEMSPATIKIATEMGLTYDSSLMADEDCYELLTDGKPSGLIELPVDWVRDDGAYLWMERFNALRPYTPPADVFDIFRRELDGAHEDGGIFQLVMHPHVIGYRSRIWILEEIIRHAKGHGDVWFASHHEVVAWAKENSSPEDVD